PLTPAQFVGTAVLAASLACAREAPPARDAWLVERAHLSMGTEVRLTAVLSDEAAAASAFDEVFREFDRLDALMTVWRDESELSRLNREAGLHQVPVSPEVREVLLIARQVSEWTEGRFDVTFGALSGLWKFDHDQDNTVPDPDEVRRQLPLVNYRDLVADES